MKSNLPRELTETIKTLKQDIKVIMQYTSKIQDKIPSKPINSPFKYLQIYTQRLATSGNKDMFAKYKNINASLMKAAALIRRHNSIPISLASYQASSLLQKKINNQIDFAIAALADMKAKEPDPRQNPFLHWLNIRIIFIHTVVKSKIRGFESDLAKGQDLQKFLSDLIYNNPEKYTTDISKAMDDIYTHFQEEKTRHDITSTIYKYLDIIKAEDVALLELVSERVRDSIKKRKVIQYEKYDKLYTLYTNLRDTLVILLANVIVHYDTSKEVVGIPPYELSVRFQVIIRSIQKLLFRTNRSQLQQKIIQTNVDTDVHQDDFSVQQFDTLKTKILNKRKKKKPPTSVSVSSSSRSIPSLSRQGNLSSTNNQQSKQQRKQTTEILGQQQQQQQQQQQLLRKSQQTQQIPLNIIQSPIGAKDNDPLHKVKQDNILLLRQEVSNLAKTIMEKAMDSGATCVLLVDVRNISTKLFPLQTFSKKRQKLLSQFNDKLIQQQLNEYDKSDVDLRKPFLVFVDQSDLDESDKENRIVVEQFSEERRIIVGVPCVKIHNGTQVDCFSRAPSQQQQQNSLKNPMDDYVLLSLSYILNKYYRDRIERQGAIAEQALYKINEFMRWNKGMARYSPDMVRLLRIRKKELSQFNKKPLTFAFILSHDMFRDWKKE